MRERRRVAVALLGGRNLDAALAGRAALEVVATARDDHVTVVRRLGANHDLVVGMAAVPWPTAGDLHQRAAEAVPAYRGVVSWHGLPHLLDALATLAAPAARTGAHVLLTAPDPGGDAAPEDVVFLREVAEGVAARVALPSRSIAWRGTTRAPTAVDALTSLVTAHAKPDVVEIPVAPGTPADPALRDTAEELGARLTTADVGRATLVASLAAVVDTVVAHEAGTR